MDDVLRIRQRLYKKAMAEKAAGIFGEIGSAGSRAVRKAGEFLGDLKHGLGFASPSGPSAKVNAAGKVIKDAPKDPLSWGGYASNLAKLVALGAGLQGAGMAVTGIMRHSRDKEMRKNIESSYKQMFDETPGLSNMDPKKVTRHFDVLARYAPSLAADPTVAGAWVKGTVQMGHIDASQVERLGATQSLIDRHHEGQALFQPGHFQSSIQLARQAMGGGAAGGGGSGG
jgi:hypothetical protein